MKTNSTNPISAETRQSKLLGSTKFWNNENAVQPALMISPAAQRSFFLVSTPKIITRLPYTKGILTLFNLWLRLLSCKKFGKQSLPCLPRACPLLPFFLEYVLQHFPRVGCRFRAPPYLLLFREFPNTS